MPLLEPETHTNKKAVTKKKLRTLNILEHSSLGVKAFETFDNIVSKKNEFSLLLPFEIKETFLGEVTLLSCDSSIGVNPRSDDKFICLPPDSGKHDPVVSCTNFWLC